MIDRHQARILALQSLCQFEVLGADFLAQLDDFLADEKPDAPVREYARRLVLETRDRMPELDAALQTVADNWDLKRMAPVDRNILRVAACEMKTQPNIPAKVAITEAVEIAKAFGTAESPGFINGILDAVLKKHLLERDDSEEQSPVANEVRPQ
ncbi:MAG: transcription antitermination factor NusB [Phycisphaerales bacterium]|nr:transcription antitermination factor NusB [Phycisphaerales bacterium]MCB9855018.1 transcription antitermination factor NusB [Phycisphaerales bacterium]MCB9863465.1 transcription antitermination factor NusB [Phycisphaerales bacterium]